MRGAQPWGRLEPPNPDVVRVARWVDARATIATPGTRVLGFGLGRSYGDVCGNRTGRLVATPWMDRILSADWAAGVIRAEAGLSLSALLHLCVPRGWFAPVSPGTKFVTLGGAVANDVHGKNHGVAGTIGRHVRALGLLRSDGTEHVLLPEDPTDLFAATVGGLGLTGLITWVELQLEKIPSAYLMVESLPMRHLDDYFRLAGESSDWPFQVAWVDCLAPERRVGRGIYSRARWATDGRLDPHREQAGKLSVPIDAPEILLNRATIAAFNALYGALPRGGRARPVHYSSFFYPLDAIHGWNRLYGRRGFFQHQSAIPPAAAPDAIRRMLTLTAAAGQGSFLVVVKEFGPLRSPGLLSFPLQGTTFALDFPNRGARTELLLERLADTAMEAGGRIYPAKDARMRADVFRAGYPDWRRVEALRDPAFVSDFWRRTVLADEAA